MATMLALLSSLLWGTADFFGGNLTKKYKALAVTGVTQTFGLLFGLIVVLITQLNVGANHEDVIKTTINPNIKPKDCETPVTASAF